MPVVPPMVTTLKSVHETGMGPAWTVQLGVFPTQQIGIFASLFFGWRDNRYDATLFETRTTAEVQVLPLQLGIFHAGLASARDPKYTVAPQRERLAQTPPGAVAEDRPPNQGERYEQGDNSRQEQYEQGVPAATQGEDPFHHLPPGPAE